MGSALGPAGLDGEQEVGSALGLAGLGGEQEVGSALGLAGLDGEQEVGSALGLTGLDGKQEVEPALRPAESRRYDQLLIYSCSIVAWSISCPIFKPNVLFFTCALVCCSYESSSRNVVSHETFCYVKTQEYSTQWMQPTEGLGMKS